MSLLAPKPAPPATPVPALVAIHVTRSRNAPRALAEHIVKTWNTEFDRIWNNPDGLTPAQMLEGIGTDAAEMFAANTALVTFLISMLTKPDGTYVDPDLVAAISAKVATIPAHTVHPDGTVTLDPP